MARKTKPKKVEYRSEFEVAHGITAGALVHAYDRKALIRKRDKRKLPTDPDAKVEPIAELPDPLDAGVVPGVLFEMATYWLNEAKWRGTDGVWRMRPMTLAEWEGLSEKAFVEIIPAVELYFGGFVGAVPSDPAVREVFELRFAPGQRTWTPQNMKTVTDYIIENHQLPEA